MTYMNNNFNANNWSLYDAEILRIASEFIKREIEDTKNGTF